MSTFRVPDNLAISDSGFLFMPSTGETFTLNPIGKEVLTLLQQQLSTEEIIKRILEEYEIDAGTLENDITDFVNQLKNFSLIKEL